MSTNSKENKHLYLYTALIFIVAILMIVLSFFGQINLDKQHNELTGEEVGANSISEKTQQLSDENRILLETNKNLNDQNAELMQRNWELDEQISVLEDTISNSEILCEAINELDSKDVEKAKETIAKLEGATLSQEQQKLYNRVKAKLGK